jgi:hypothetical protein
LFNEDVNSNVQAVRKTKLQHTNKGFIAYITSHEHPTAGLHCSIVWARVAILQLADLPWVDPLILAWSWVRLMVRAQA